MPFSPPSKLRLKEHGLPLDSFEGPRVTSLSSRTGTGWQLVRDPSSTGGGPIRFAARALAPIAAPTGISTASLLSAACQVSTEFHFAADWQSICGVPRILPG